MRAWGTCRFWEVGYAGHLAEARPDGRPPITARGAAPYQVSWCTKWRCPRREGDVGLSWAGLGGCQARARSTPRPGCCLPAPRPDWGRERQRPAGSRPLRHSQKVRFSFTTKSPGPPAPLSGPGGRGPAGREVPQSKVGRDLGSAGGLGAATATRRLHLLGSRLGGAGWRDRFFQTQTKKELGEAGAALFTGVLSRV